MVTKLVLFGEVNLLFLLLKKQERMMTIINTANPTAPVAIRAAFFFFNSLILFD